MKKECVNCPGAVDHSTAECPLACAGQRNMEGESRSFEAWRNAQVESLRRMGYPEAADAFYNLGSVQWAGWQARTSLAVGVPDGYALVPVEPTAEMLAAARAAPIPAVLLDSISAQDNLAQGAKYRAMLAAAPAAPTVKESLSVAPTVQAEQAYPAQAMLHECQKAPSLPAAGSADQIVTDAMIDRAMNAPIPGGSQAWVWLFNCEGGRRPEEKHKDFFRRVLAAALSAQQSAPERVSVDRALIERFAHGRNSFEDIRLLQEFLASHGRGEA